MTIYLPGLLVALSLGGALILPEGHAYGPLIFAAMGLWAVISRRRPALNEFLLPLIAAMLFLIAHGLIMWWHQEPIKEFEYLAPFLLLPLVCWGLFSRSIASHWIWLGLCLVAITAGGIPLLQMLGAPGPARFSGIMTNPIAYGNLCVLVATACLVGLSTYASHASRLMQMGLALGLALGLAGSFLSGSKGGWVSIVLTWPVLLIWSVRQMSRARALVLIALLALTFCVGLLSPKSPMAERIYSAGLAVKALVTHLISDEADTSMPTDGSVGPRAAMWKHALSGPAFENIWIGIARTPLRAAQKEAAQNGTAPGILGDWAHLHNEPLDIFVTKGLIGFVALLVLWWLWARFFYLQVQSQSNPSKKGLAMTGLLVLVQLAEFSLTNPQLKHLSMALFAGFLMVAIASNLRDQSDATWQ